MCANSVSHDMSGLHSSVHQHIGRGGYSSAWFLFPSFFLSWTDQHSRTTLKMKYRSPSHLVIPKLPLSPRHTQCVLRQTHEAPRPVAVAFALIASVPAHAQTLATPWQVLPSQELDARPDEAHCSVAIGLTALGGPMGGHILNIPPPISMLALGARAQGRQ
jgi:hypothetical protein